MHRISVHSPGGYGALRYEEALLPQPGPGDVLVATEAVGVNFADVVVRLGLYPSAKEYVGWPITPGFEFAGRVLEVGEGVTEFRPGDAVFGGARFGAYASHVCVPAGYLLPLPEELSMKEAASLVVAGITAWYGAVHLGQVVAGSEVLVHSAAGGVGSLLVQVAKAQGARVTAVVGRKEKKAYVEGLGAAVVIVKGDEDWKAAAKRSAPHGYDVVLDANGYETQRASYRLLRPTGRLVIYGAHSMLSRGHARPNPFKLLWGILRMPRFHPIELTNDNKSVIGFNLSYLFDEAPLLRAGIQQIVTWVKAKQVVPPPFEVFPLSQAGRAHAVLQGGAVQGKVLLVPET
jgi:synaptic vesicle membrane protein VAT-1